MKGLKNFISEIRSCPNKEAESKRVELELSKIRTKFTTDKKLSSYDKKKYVWKLMYAYMLGYDVNFGHIQAVFLCSGTTYSEKCAGYLACSLLLQEKYDVLRLIINVCKSDLQSENQHIVALSLNTITNIGGAEFSENLFPDVSRLLRGKAPQSSYVIKKACLCLLRLYRHDQSIITADEWVPKLTELLDYSHSGLILSVTNLIIGILEHQSQQVIAEWKSLVTPIVLALSRVVVGDVDPPYMYYTVPAPWLQVRLIRALQFFPCYLLDDGVLARVNEIVERILARPVSTHAIVTADKKGGTKAESEKVNRYNAEHSVLFEAMNLVIHMEDECLPENRRKAAALLGEFIASKESNIRLVSISS